MRQTRGLARPERRNKRNWYFGKMTEKSSYGYTVGQAGLEVERVRKARKKYDCEGALIDSDAVPPTIQLSPATGPVVRMGCAPTCSVIINAGDLYVAVELSGDVVKESWNTYRHTCRTCIPCALHFEVIRQVDL